jgi:predicted P-loop ATPase
MTGGRAQSSNRSTFGTFEQAIFAKDMNGYEGVGIGIFDDICAVDIDHCIQDGVFSDLATQVMGIMDSYTEISPSGSGLRILFRAPGLQYDTKKYYINNQRLGLEIYAAGVTKKYVTITGNTVHKCGINDRTDELEKVLDLFMCREVPNNGTTEPKVIESVMLMGDMDVCNKAEQASNGQLFKNLMAGNTTDYNGDDSRADIALCNVLAFYTKDAAQIDRIFRSSGLMREKWDRKTGSATYGEMTIQSALSRVTDQYTPGRQPTEIAQPKSTQTRAVAPATDDIGEPVGPYDVLLIPTKSGYEKSARNVLRILQQDPTLAQTIYYDAFRCALRVRGELPWPSAPGPRDWDNADDSMLRNYVENYIVDIAQTRVNDALVQAAMDRAIDPLVAFLESLVWDKQPRIATALHDYLGVEQSEWSARVMKHWLVGAVKRGYEPGCKFDEMLLLYGDQGAGKSTFISRFCPDSEWFLENLTRIDDKDALQVLRGKWIVCFDEMLAQKRSDMREMCKSFLVSRVDTFRPSYGRRFENHKRRCCFAGSTNERYVLTDRSGNRRYLPVTCNKDNAPKNHLIFDHSPEVTNEFMQMVAEAVWIYKNEDYKLAVTGEFQDMQNMELMKYMEEDSREGIIGAYLANTTAERVCIPMISYEALGGSKTPTKRETNELHELMRCIPGWVLYDKNGGRARCGEYGTQTCYVRKGTVIKEELLKKGELL